MTHTPLRPYRPRKSIAAALLAVGLIAGGAPVAQAGPEAASLTVTFKGMKSPSGAILLALVAGPEAYAEKAPPTAQSRLVVAGPTADVTFRDLKPGAYAIRAFHDVNGDGTLNTNPFGIPIEPYAFSNNAHGAMGPPGWDAASITLKAGDNRQTIDID